MRSVLGFFRLLYNYQIVRTFLVLCVGLVAVLILRSYVIAPYQVPSESMEPTLNIGDRFLAAKVFDSFNAGDIIIFDSEAAGFNSAESVTVKRVIATEGQTVSASGGFVVVDDELVLEPYLSSRTVTSDFDPVVVPEGHVFVMGDNRSRSADSRVFGPVPVDSILGQAVVVFWAPQNISLL